MSDVYYCQSQSPACLERLNGRTAIGPNMLLTGASEIVSLDMEKPKKSADKVLSSPTDPKKTAISVVEEYELADYANDLNIDDANGRASEGCPEEDDFVKVGCMNERTDEYGGTELAQCRVVGTVELPAESMSSKTATESKSFLSKMVRRTRKYATLPKAKKRTSQARWYYRRRLPLVGGASKEKRQHMQSRPKRVPTRVTPDGTSIYYWCDAGKGQHMSVLGTE